MEDKVINIIFGSLGIAIALISLLFAYIQYRRSRPATAADEEHHMLPIMVTHDEPVIDHPYVSCLAT